MQAKTAHHVIWNSIKELLHKHDCVIVPDFGGFVCNREQSRIDQVSHIITPPGKRIVFNQNLKTNDGLLAQAISEKLALTYSEALRSINELVNQLRAELEQIKQLDIEAFGSFRLNADANYVFLPDRLNTYLYESFGLMPLQIIPVNGQYNGGKQTRIFKDRKEVREARRLVRAKHAGLKMLTVTLVAMLFLNGYIFLTDANLIGGVKISTTGINTWFDSLIKPEQHTDNKPNAGQPQQTEVLTTTTPEADTTTLLAIGINEQVLSLAEVFASIDKSAPVYEHAITDDISLPLTEDTQPTESAGTIPPEPIKDNSIKVSGRFSYHVIGGVFCKERNALKFYNQLREQGFEAELLLNANLNCNRVSYRKLYSLEDAIQLMDSIKTGENPDAWILTVSE